MSTINMNDSTVTPKSISYMSPYDNVALVVRGVVTLGGTVFLSVISSCIFKYTETHVRTSLRIDP